jgi:hypothetical protein
MAYPIDKKYYINRKPELLKQFEKEMKYWSPIVFSRYGEIQGYKILVQTRQEFEKLIPEIPYIGGDENVFTKNFVESVMYLALYRTMRSADFTVEETGRILYEAGLVKYRRPVVIPPKEKLTPRKVMERRQKTAALSQERRYPADYVYTFVPGAGKKFDYGFDFTECATQKLYKAHGAEELLPYYCYLDFVSAKVRGFKFTRTQNLYAGHSRCNHRFKVGGVTKAPWPPPFLKRKKK